MRREDEFYVSSVTVGSSTFSFNFRCDRRVDLSVIERKTARIVAVMLSGPDSGPEEIERIATEIFRGQLGDPVRVRRVAGSESLPQMVIEINYERD